MLRSVQFMIYGASNFGSAGFHAMKNQEVDGEHTGKTFLVTGGNSGLGFDTCNRLAKTKAEILLVARNEERGKAAVEKIGSPNVKLVLCDVSKQADVANMIGKIEKLDALILNAGSLFSDDKWEETEDGVERTLATNVVNNVQLIEGLMPVLKKSADPRVIFVASGGGLTEPLVKTEEEYRQGKFTGMTAYARTKRMQMALAKYYARHYPDIGFYAMHPGWSDTPGVQSSIPGFYDTMKSRFRTSEEGADTICWLAVTPSLDKKEHSGALFRDREVELEHFKFGGTEYTEDDQEQMYKYLRSKLKS